MKASETKLQKLIEGTNQYVIPLFQRTYSWKSSNWEDLWADIQDLLEEPNSEHFIGPIVTAPAQSVPEGVAKYLVIDGQQRLTTLQILLAAIRDRARELRLEPLGPEIDETLLRNKFKQGNEQYKLLPTQADRVSFQNIIDGKQVEAKDQVTRCHAFFRRKLKDHDEEQLLKLKNTVVSRLMLVSIILDKDDNPHVIFESLNSKGADLTQADLIRNYFLMKVHVDDQERVFRDLWEPIQQRLGDNTTEFIRHFLMLSGTWVRKDAVYLRLRQDVDRSGKAAMEALERLARFSSYYQRILFPESAEKDVGLQERMIRLARIDFSTAHPLLLACYDSADRGQMTKDDLHEVLDVLENFLVRRMICNVPSQDLARFFPTVFQQAKGANGFLIGLRTAIASRRYPGDAEFGEHLKGSQLYVPGEKAQRARYLLERIERSFEHKEPPSLDSCTIEHIMPQTLSDAWRAELGKDAEVLQELWCHTFGNLTLSAYNSELGNAPFGQKRERFAASNLHLNKKLAEFTSWTPETIQERAEWLRGHALRIYPHLTGNQSSTSVGNKPPNNHARPLKTSLMGENRTTSTWREVLTFTLEVLCENFDDAAERLCKAMPGRINRDRESFRRPLPLPGGFFYETNLSQMTIKDICRAALQELGVETSDWQVDIK